MGFISQPGSSGSAGQTTVTKVVASSGGDYTTLGAALAAAVDGWTISLSPGTYVETTITSAINNLTIKGNGPENTIVGLNTILMTLSGANVHIEGIKFTASTGGMLLSGTNWEFINNHISKSGATRSGFKSTGDYGKFTGNYVEQTAANAAAYTVDYATGNYLVCSNNTYNLWGSGSTELIDHNTSTSVISNNVYRLGGGSGTAPLMIVGGTYYNVVSGNTMDLTNTANTGIQLNCGFSEIVGNYIHVNGAYCIQTLGASNAISGNTIHNSLSTGFGLQAQTGTAWNTITGNQFTGNNVSTSKGIVLNGDFDYNVISGNQFYNWSIGVHIQSTSANWNTITGNGFAANVTATVTNVEETTHIVGNQGVDVTLERKTARMKNNSGGTLNVGDAVILDTTVAALDNVTTTTAAGSNKVIGMVAETITSAAYGTILLTGKTISLKADGTTDIAVGDFLSTFTTAKIVQKASAGQTAIAIALEAYATNDSLGVIDAMLIAPRTI